MSNLDDQLGSILTRLYGTAMNRELDSMGIREAKDAINNLITEAVIEELENVDERGGIAARIKQLREEGLNNE